MLNLKLTKSVFFFVTLEHFENDLHKISTYCRRMTIFIKLKPEHYL